MANYWIVGATWYDDDGEPCEMENDFVRTGVWKLGWSPSHFTEYPGAEVFYNRITEINCGDRIAIKRMRGKGQQEVNILHIGVVRGYPFIWGGDKYGCIVDWANREPFEGKVVGLHGWVGSGPYGPYSRDERDRFENFEIERTFSL